MDTPVKLGDLLELLGFACAAVAAALYFNIASALVVVAVALIYEGQCFSATSIPDPPKPHLWIRRKIAARRSDAATIT